MADTTDTSLPTTFRLMDFPNEVIREICNRPELKRNDLRALRLTSKHLYEIVLKRFAKECYSKITVLMCRPSLEAFIKLSEHPYYGSFVKKINISPIYGGILSHAAFLPSGAPGSINAFDIRGPHWTAWRGLRDELRTCDSVELLLGVAFKAFAQRGQCFELQFCDDESNAIGSKDSMHDEIVERISIWKMNWTTTIERTIRAAYKHGCTITELSIGESSLKRCVADSSLCTDKIEPQLGSLCSQIARLHVCLYDDGIESASKSVECMVSAAKNLKVLNLERLCNWDDLEPHFYPAVLDCVVSKCLETIVIGEFQISEQELIDFLNRQRRTLRKLQLLGGCLFEGSCMSLIAWIRDNLLSLKYLEFWEICDCPNHPDCDDWNQTRSYRVCGSKDMQVCLANILDGKCEKKVKVEEIDENQQVEEIDEYEQSEEDNVPERVEEDDM